MTEARERSRPDYAALKAATRRLLTMNGGNTGGARVSRLDASSLSRCADHAVPERFLPIVCGGDKTIHWNASVLLSVAE